MLQRCLIPWPAALAETPGAFALGDDLSIVVAHGAERGAWIAAQGIQAALAAHSIDAPIQPQLSCPDTARSIVLAVANRDEAVFPTALPAVAERSTAGAGEPVADAQHQEAMAGEQVALEAPEREPGGADSGSREAYHLRVEDRHIAIWGASPAGLAHGARTLCQLLAGAQGHVSGVSIDDAPALPWRGVLLDVSRGKVPRLETLMRIVDVIASVKLNLFQLYVEHTFAFRRHPRIGAGSGALTPEEIVALDGYCRERYIELVPCLQSLGHHQHLLALPEYAHLAVSEAGWTLRPGEETNALLADLFADFLAPFTSRYVNVCCDEPYDLTQTTWQTHLVAAGYRPANGDGAAAATDGHGAAPAEADIVRAEHTTNADPAGHVDEGSVTPGARLYLQHMQHLHGILAGFGKTMLMWDDVFLHFPALLKEMPTDVVMLDWFYEALDDYPQVARVAAGGFTQVVCPGTSSWNTLFARLDNARANIHALVASGRRAGAVGVLTTDWGDRGHPNLLASSWYGYLYTAQEGWGPQRLEAAEFERCFARLFFGEEDGPGLQAVRALSMACTLPGILRYNGSCSRDMFFGDPLADADCRAAPDEAVERMRTLGLEARAALQGLRGQTPEAAATLDELRLAAEQVVHAATKTQVGRRLAAAPEAMEEGTRADLYDQLVALKRDLHAVRREYERIWLRRNKPEGLWQTLDQFDQAAAVLDRWRARVLPPSAVMA